MGQDVSTARRELLKGENAEMKEQLHILVKLANYKLDGYQYDLEKMFTDNEHAGKTSVPGMRAMRFQRGYRVGIKDDTVWGISDVVDDYFGLKISVKANANASSDSKAGAGAGAEGEGGSGPLVPTGGAAAGAGAGASSQSSASSSVDVTILRAFKKNVESQFAGILQNRFVGESEDRQFFVVVLHNAVVRVDVSVWRYNFTSGNVLAGTENVLAYIMCASVVDTSILRFDELLFLYSEHAGDDFVGRYIDKIKENWYKLQEMNRVMDGRFTGPDIRTLAQVTAQAQAQAQASASSSARGGSAGLLGLMPGV